MKQIKLLLLACLVTQLMACSSIGSQQPVDVTSTTTATPGSTNNPPLKPCPHHKNPLNVSIYPCGANPKHPYQVVGLEAVSKYNLVGIKRQEGNIRDTLRKVAASMGGDAIIDLKYDKKIVKGTVITYDGKSDSSSPV